MTDQMQQELLKRLDILAAKLGVTANHIWGVLVKQASIEGLQWLIWLALWIALTTTLIIVGSKIWDWAKKEDEIGLYVFSCIIRILSMGPIVGITISINYIIYCFANPEHYALMSILGALK